MLGKTHKAFALATTAGAILLYHKVTGHSLPTDLLTSGADTSLNPLELVATPSNQISTTLIMTNILLGSLPGSEFPDLDQKLGIPHRTWTHTIWMVLLSALATWAAITMLPLPVFIKTGFVTPLLIGFTIGLLSHLIGDAYSTSGIAWFYPFEGYVTYMGGAKVKKGFRGPFVPIYKVGTRLFGIIPGWLPGGALAIWLIILCYISLG